MSKQLTFAQFRRLVAKKCAEQGKHIAVIILKDIGYEGFELAPVLEILDDLYYNNYIPNGDEINDAIEEAANQFSK